MNMNFSKRSYQELARLISGERAPKTITFKKVAAPHVKIGRSRMTAYQMIGTRHKMSRFNSDLIPAFPEVTAVTIRAETSGPKGFNPPLVFTPAIDRSQEYHEKR
jgi:hypothetical protein